MNYTEKYEISKNPFVFNGVIGRLAYFATGIIFSMIMCILVWLLCPQTIDILANQPSNGKAPVEIMFAFAPIHEAVIYILITLFFLGLFFILNKKRLLDIMGEHKNALKAAVLMSGVMFIMGIQSNFLAEPNSPQAILLSVGFLIINLFLYFKKGKVTGTLKPRSKNENT